jgi:hypothetical protein
MTALGTSCIVPGQALLFGGLIFLLPLSKDIDQNTDDATGLTDG